VTETDGTDTAVGDDRETAAASPNDVLDRGTIDRIEELHGAVMRAEAEHRFGLMRSKRTPEAIEAEAAERAFLAEHGFAGYTDYRLRIRRAAPGRVPTTSPAPIDKATLDPAGGGGAASPPPSEKAPATGANDVQPSITEIMRHTEPVEATLEDPGSGRNVGPGTGTMTRVALVAGFVGGAACSLAAATAIRAWRNRRRARHTVIRLDGARPSPSWTTDDLVAWLRNPG
jgi:hypothetical protein